MNIIVFGNKEWDVTNAFGNTISNFFEGNIWKNDTFYSIYMRDSLPNNKVCHNYYKVTLKDMIINYFNKEKIGKMFIMNDNTSVINTKESISEGKIIDIIHNYSLNFVYTLADTIYRKRKWLNVRFENYIKEANPDIFFSFLTTNASMLYPMIEYLKKNSNAKVVLFLADNVLQLFENMNNSRKKKLMNDFIKSIKMADKVYGITDDLCEEYSRIFDKKIDLLCKGCTFEYPVKDNINNTIRFVYAGNLFYGRDEILSKVANAIKKNNSTNSQKAILEIYTGSTITEELMNKLNIDKCSIIKGKKDYTEIKNIMNKAEYNLEIESFDQKHIEYVKFSFSTKITDCLQSGSASIAIGPSIISSIKYMKKVPGVFVIESINDIEKEVIRLINEKNKIIKNATFTREYAVNNHDIGRNQEKIRKDFIKLIEE